MGRRGITLEDVSSAAETLRDEGQTPTVDRVREFLGTGSKSTITPLLRQWRRQQSESVDLSELPEEISRAVVALHKQLQSVAQQRIDNNEDKLNQERTRWSESLDTLKQTASEQQSTMQTLEQSLKAAEEREQSLSRSLQAHQVQLAKAETQRDAALQESGKLQDLYTHQQQELTALREQFEHYQQRAAEERHREREEFLLTRQQLEDSLHRLQGMLTEANAQNASSQQVLAQYRSKQDDLHQQQLEHTALIEQLKSHNQSLAQQLNSSEVATTSLQEQNNHLQQQLNQIHAELAAVSASRQQQTEQLQSLNEQIKQERKENQTLITSHARLEAELAVMQHQKQD